MEPEGSKPFTQHHATGTYPEPVESSPQYHIADHSTIRSILMYMITVTIILNHNPVISINSMIRNKDALIYPNRRKKTVPTQT
jgi:hypothetical protein